MDRLLGEIAKLEEILSAPSLRPSEEIHFPSWKDQYRHWRALLSELNSTVAEYFRLEPRLSTINNEHYKNEGWTFDQSRFPNSDLIHDYKTFRLLANNLRDLTQPMTVAVRREAAV